MKPRFGIASYSFHGLFGLGAMTAVQYLETIRYRYNVEYADIWNHMLASYDEDYLKMLRAQMDERGLTLANLCCDGAHPWDDAEDVRNRNDAMAADCLRAARILGAQSIRFDVGIQTDTATDEQIDYVARKFSAYAKTCAEFGAKFGPENHWGASRDIAVIRKLIQAVNAPNYGHLLHLGNWQGKTPEDKFANDLEMAPKSMHMHMHFEACQDADHLFPLLAKAGYPGVWSIESHKSTNEYNNVAFQLAQARRVITPFDY
ncbi:MAG: sugar phosphate isomerase/epimerase [Clostridia bacterium]|nr:sugar phosphate isomerase/epimerase [Clostridia bacterium]